MGKVSRRSILYDTHSDFRERCHVRHQTTQQSQYEMSLLSVYVNDHPSLRAEMTRILTREKNLHVTVLQNVSLQDLPDPTPLFPWPRGFLPFAKGQ